MSKPGQRTWTDEQLASAVAACSTWAAVARHLGLRRYKGKTTLMLRRHAARLHLDVAHMPKPRTTVAPMWSPAPGESAQVEYLDVDPEKLRAAVIAAPSWISALAELGFPRGPVNYRRIRASATLYGVTLGADRRRFCAYSPCGSQFTGKKSSRFCSQACYRASRFTVSIEQWLETGEIGALDKPGPHIRRYLLREQASKCAICHGSDEWMGRSLQFIMDHVDGNADNNRRENLRLICPNCDSQLVTYKGRNLGHGRHARRERYAASKSY
jgi:hypothetical protein